jgi:PAS domain S-box-containing protein
MSMFARPQWIKLAWVPNYLIAVLSVAVAVAVDLGFNRLWEAHPTVSLFLCAIMFVAWTSGTAAALLATALSVLAFDFFFLKPFGSLILQFKDIPPLVLFTVAALLVVLLSAAQRRATAALQFAHDAQQETVKELQALNEKLRLENAERRQAEQRARRAEQELQLTVDTIPVLAARYRPDGFIEFRNKTWRNYTGLSRDNLEGQRWGVAPHPDDIPMIEREWTAHIATGEAFEVEQRLRRADGEYRWHWIRRVPLRDETGEVIKWYGVAFDIDDRRRVENALLQSEADLAKARHELQLIIDTVPVLMLRHRADGVIDFVNQVGRSYSGILSTNWTKRTSTTTHPDDVSRLEEAWDVALATGEPFETEARLRRADGEYRWFMTRRVPLRNGDGDVVAWYAAGYDIEDRKRAEDALRRSEAELVKARYDLQLTIDTIPALVARYEPDGTPEFANQTWRDYDGPNFAIEKLFDICHPEDLPRVKGLWHEHLATGEPFESEQRLRRADGEYRLHFMKRVPYRDETGKVMKWYGSGYDLEDRKRAEDSLRRSEADLAKARQDLQLMIDTISSMVVALDQDGNAYFANRSAQEYIGKDYPVKNVRDLIHPDDRDRIDRLWRIHLESGEPFQTEQRMKRADGQYRWNHMTRVPLRDETGKATNWYMSGYDIEDRKVAENALRASEAQLAKAQRELELTIDSIPVMVSTFEPDGTRSYVNQTWQNYTGNTLLEVTDRGPDTSVHYHPADVRQFDSAWRAARAKGEAMSVDVRARRADGAYRWFTMRRAPRRDESGNIVKWYSVGIDVEDQKIAEQALREREAQLAKAERELQLTLDTIPTLAWRTRADGFAEYLNKRWLDYTGFSREQAQGWDWQTAVYPDDVPQLLDAWREMLASKSGGEVEARMRRHDGAYRWFLFRTEPLLDESSSVVAWFGTNTDIEDRKRVESALQRSEAYSAEAQKLSQTGSIAWDFITDEHFWSDETYQIMGFDRSVQPTMNLIQQRVHPDDRVHLQGEVSRTLKGGQDYDYEQRLLMPDGRTKYIHVRAHRVKYESGKEEVVGALMDITAAKKAQAELDAAQTALAHASRVAALAEISATIAHEVNQPLAAIVANGQACLRFLRREPLSLDDVRGTVEWIVKDGNRASEVIRRVRGLLKKADVEKVPLDVNDVVNEVAALLHRELAARHVTPLLELAPAIPLSIGDRIQLQQVIINLVMNGIEAMHPITDRPHALIIRSYEDEAQRIVVAIKDAGVGIPAETAERLFDAFFSTKPSGLGMGLSICRSIIEDHGGRLWATDNGAMPGATFHFALPAYRDGAT